MANKREEILDAGYTILARSGLEGLHARTVAAEVGVHHAAVHYYFRTRPDLLYGVFEYLRLQFFDDREKMLKRNPAPGDALEVELALVEAYCSPRSRFFKALMALQNASIEDATLAQKVKSFLDEWTGKLQASIDRAAASRRLVKGTPLAHASLLLAWILGTGQLAQGLGPKLKKAQHFDAIATAILK